MFLAKHGESGEMINITLFKKSLFIWMIMVGVLFFGPVRAQEISPESNNQGGVDLREQANPDPERKKHLEELQQRWKTLSPERQAKLKERFQEFKQLPPEERELLMQRFRRFQRLSPDAQGRIKGNLKRWRGLPKERKMELRKKFESFKKLTPAQREKIRERAKERNQREHLRDLKNGSGSRPRKK